MKTDVKLNTLLSNTVENILQFDPNSKRYQLEIIHNTLSKHFRN